MVKKEYTTRAFWIYCRSCGIEYLESKEWVVYDSKTECPNCGNKMVIN